jgi:hypothetical protein
MSNTAIAAWILVPLCTALLMLWTILRFRDRGE